MKKKKIKVYNNKAECIEIEVDIDDFSELGFLKEKKMKELNDKGLLYFGNDKNFGIE